MTELIPHWLIKWINRLQLRVNKWKQNSISKRGSIA